jgi:hypothetical protein
VQDSTLLPTTEVEPEYSAFGGVVVLVLQLSAWCARRRVSRYVILVVFIFRSAHMQVAYEIAQIGVTQWVDGPFGVV